MKFLKGLYHDSRIPKRDKAIIITLCILIVSPLDLIPDWVPFFGYLDDLVMIGIVTDYLYNHLDQEIILSHWTSGMKSYIFFKRIGEKFAIVAPKLLRKVLFKFKPKPF
jgi:uncharacterized membrane protein YkvA (DUF1232 family)